MGDTIRGKQYLDYPEEVQRGILLHRQIDTFTDAHPLFRESKRRLVPLYGHYAGVITDIFYDYFLTKHWRVFSSEDFDGYIERFYALLQEKKEVQDWHESSIRWIDEPSFAPKCSMRLPLCKPKNLSLKPSFFLFLKKYKSLL